MREENRNQKLYIYNTSFAKQISNSLIKHTFYSQSVYIFFFWKSA